MKVSEGVKREYEDRRAQLFDRITAAAEGSPDQSVKELVTMTQEKRDNNNGTVRVHNSLKGVAAAAAIAVVALGAAYAGGAFDKNEPPKTPSAQEIQVSQAEDEGTVAISEDRPYEPGGANVYHDKEELRTLAEASDLVCDMTITSVQTPEGEDYVDLSQSEELSGMVYVGGTLTHTFKGDCFGAYDGSEPVEDIGFFAEPDQVQGLTEGDQINVFLKARYSEDPVQSWQVWELAWGAKYNVDTAGALTFEPLSGDTVNAALLDYALDTFRGKSLEEASGWLISHGIAFNTDIAAGNGDNEPGQVTDFEITVEEEYRILSVTIRCMDGGSAQVFDPEPYQGSYVLDAAAELKDSGFTPVFRAAYSNEVAPYFVIGVDKDSDRPGEVTITYSMGDMALKDKWAGMTEEDAEYAAFDQGIETASINKVYVETTDPDKAGTVQESCAAAGEALLVVAVDHNIVATDDDSYDEAVSSENYDLMEKARPQAYSGGGNVNNYQMVNYSRSFGETQGFNGCELRAIGQETFDVEQDGRSGDISRIYFMVKSTDGTPIPEGTRVMVQEGSLHCDPNFASFKFSDPMYIDGKLVYYVEFSDYRITNDTVVWPDMVNFLEFTALYQDLGDGNIETLSQGDFKAYFKF